MVDVLSEVGNASSVHQEGRRARQYLERARGDIAEWLGVSTQRVIFTSGATEANGAVLAQASGEALVSAIEHPSVLASDHRATIAVDQSGAIELGDLHSKLADTQPKLVSIMAMNNETGVIQPIDEAARVARANGALLHVDAVQSLGRIKIEPDGADYFTLSAHKIGGPKGVGAIVVPEGVAWRSSISGGGQEQRRRAGTENVAAAVGFAAALRSIEPVEEPRIGRLRESLEKTIAQSMQHCRIVAQHATRGPHISAITIPGRRAETLVMQLDLQGIAVSAGSACSSGKVQRSHVLDAMGLSSSDAESTIRVSLGWNSDDHEIDHLIGVLGALPAATAT